ncbi:RNA polymerase sigma-70 factor [Mucilaginibacter sp.]|uniref:RNA polymerase sigma factor n=1 Tax=Mucilaginibacter sp. TaxID=1882438 RepID=UPI002ED1C206
MNLAYQDEQQLIEQLRHSSETAFDHIYDVYWKPLFKYAYNRLQSEELAKDMVQEVFISLWNKKDTLEPATSLSAYLFSILRFKLIDHYHASEVRKRHALTVTYVAPPTNNNTDQKVHLSEINSLLSLSIKNLPNKMKEIFELSRIQGHSTRQISEDLNISEQTVKNQLSTALKRLRLNFTDYLTFAVLCYLLK